MPRPSEHPQAPDERIRQLQEQVNALQLRNAYLESLLPATQHSVAAAGHALNRVPSNTLFRPRHPPNGRDLGRAPVQRVLSNIDPRPVPGTVFRYEHGSIYRAKPGAPRTDWQYVKDMAQVRDDMRRERTERHTWLRNQRTKSHDSPNLPGGGVSGEEYMLHVFDSLDRRWEAGRPGFRSPSEAHFAAQTMAAVQDGYYTHVESNTSVYIDRTGKDREHHARFGGDPRGASAMFDGTLRTPRPMRPYQDPLVARYAADPGYKSLMKAMEHSESFGAADRRYADAVFESQIGQMARRQYQRETMRRAVQDLWDEDNAGRSPSDTTEVPNGYVARSVSSSESAFIERGSSADRIHIVIPKEVAGTTRDFSCTYTVSTWNGDLEDGTFATLRHAGIAIHRIEDPHAVYYSGLTQIPKVRKVAFFFTRPGTYFINGLPVVVPGNPSPNVRLTRPDAPTKPTLPEEPSPPTPPVRPTPPGGMRPPEAPPYVLPVPPAPREKSKDSPKHPSAPPVEPSRAPKDPIPPVAPPVVPPLAPPVVPPVVPPGDEEKDRTKPRESSDARVDPALDAKIRIEMKEEDIFAKLTSAKEYTAKSGRLYKKLGDSVYYNSRPTTKNTWGRVDNDTPTYIEDAGTFIEVEEALRIDSFRRLYWNADRTVLFNQDGKTLEEKGGVYKHPGAFELYYKRVGENLEECDASGVLRSEFIKAIIDRLNREGFTMQYEEGFGGEFGGRQITFTHEKSNRRLFELGIYTKAAAHVVDLKAEKTLSCRNFEQVLAACVERKANIVKAFDAIAKANTARANKEKYGAYGDAYLATDAVRASFDHADDVLGQILNKRVWAVVDNYQKKTPDGLNLEDAVPSADKLAELLVKAMHPDHNHVDTIARFYMLMHERTGESKYKELAITYLRLFKLPEKRDWGGYGDEDRKQMKANDEYLKKLEESSFISPASPPASPKSPEDAVASDADIDAWITQYEEITHPEPVKDLTKESFELLQAYGLIPKSQEFDEKGTKLTLAGVEWRVGQLFVEKGEKADGTIIYASNYVLERADDAATVVVLPRGGPYALETFEAAAKRALAARESEAKDPAGIKGFEVAGSEKVGYLELYDGNDAVTKCLHKGNRHMSSILSKRYTIADRRSIDYADTAGVAASAVEDAIADMQRSGVNNMFIDVIAHGSEYGAGFGGRHLSKEDMTRLVTKFPKCKFTLKVLSCHGAGMDSMMANFKDVASAAPGRVTVFTQTKEDVSNFSTTYSFDRTQATTAYNVAMAKLLLQGVDAAHPGKKLTYGEAHLQADKVARLADLVDPEAMSSQPGKPSKKTADTKRPEQAGGLI